MQRSTYSFIAMVLCLCGASWQAMAQPNILGLPAVPQNTVVATPAPVASAAGAKAAPKTAGTAKGAASGATSGASAAGAALINDVDIKAVLNGGVTMASSYTSTLATVKVTTNASYKGDLLRAQAVTAAKLVQRDVRLACGKQCKAAKMPAPKLRSDGKLEFDLVIDSLPRALSSDDMMNMLLGKPMAVLAPVPVKPAITVVPANGVSASVTVQPAPADNNAAPAAPAAPAPPPVAAPVTPASAANTAP
jgi:hypothetical protein